MSIQSDLEAALLTLLKASPALAGVKTFEAEVRDCLFADEARLIQGFEPASLPAINLSGQLDPTIRSPFTAGETQHDVPFSIIVVTKAQNRGAARRAAKALQEGVEDLLDSLRRSGNVLGQNALVMGDVTSSITTIQHSPHCYATGTTAVKIKKITATP